jgi:uncharacterized protein YjbI with pentapeptide repeats
LRVADAVRLALDRTVGGPVVVVAGAGCDIQGVSLFLATTLPDVRVHGGSDSLAGGVHGDVAAGHVIVVSDLDVPSLEGASVVELLPWNRDDVIAYATTTHAERASDVLSRLDLDAEQAWLHGASLCWRVLIDILASRPSVGSAREVFAREVRSLATRPGAETIGHACVEMQRPLPFGENAIDDADRRRGYRVFLRGQPLSTEERALMATPPALVLAAIEEVERALLADDEACPFELAPFQAGFLSTLAEHVRPGSDFERRLHSRFEDPDAAGRGDLASVLHRSSGRVWRPRHEDLRSLGLADFSRASWAEADLRKARLIACRFDAADLRHAEGRGAAFRGCNFDRATLMEAHLRDSSFLSCTFRDADLTSLNAPFADFTQCGLQGADLRGADLRWSTLQDCDLSGADLRQANLRSISILTATMEGARLCGLDLTDAELHDIDLQSVDLGKGCLRRAKLTRVWLDGAELRGLDLEGAALHLCDLTGARMSFTNLQGARLRGCSLASIDLEGADLRRVHIRESTFHLGSTRSGCLSGAPTSHGTRTGFYTEETEELGFRPPEEIRKANLRGCDLREADLLDIDLYLVDLRDARMDASLREWALKCGALL